MKIVAYPYCTNRPQGRRRPTAFLAALVAALFVFTAGARAQTFNHPGVRHSRGDLELMKTRINGNQQPWRSAYDSMLTWTGFRDGKLGRTPSSLSFPPAPRSTIDVGAFETPHTGQDEAETDASAAYIHAMQWYVTGNAAHAQKAHEILNAWGNTLTTITGANKELAAAWICSMMCDAAEIVRTTYPGQLSWTSFDNMLRTKFWPVLQNFKPTYNGNWDAHITEAIMSMGVVLNDRAIFNTGRDYFLSGPGLGSMPNYVHTDGTTQETTRDQSHEQMGVLALTNAAEIAWKQGEDLYGALSNRLLLGLEGTAQRVMAISSQTIFSGWDIAYNHYHNRKGLSTPQMQALMNSTRHNGAIWSYNTIGLWPLITFRNLVDPPWPVPVNAATITPTADTFAQGGTANANTNFGTNLLLTAKDDGTSSADFDRVAYLKFDLSSLPTRPTSATLLLYSDGTTQAGTVTARDVAADTWSETGLTWNNRPATGAALGSAAIAAGQTNSESIDVSGFVLGEYDGDQTATLALTGNNAHLDFKSRENTASLRPGLVFTGGGARVWDNFSATNANWTNVSGGTWTATGGKLQLTTPAAPTGAQPNGNIRVHNASLTGDFTLTVDASVVPSGASAFDDFSVIFGYVSSSNYYFASSNESNDANTSGIFHYNGTTNTQLVDFAATIVPGTTYTVKVEYVGTTLKVYRGPVGGALTLLATHTVTLPPGGKIGLGTRNDAATFDNVLVP
ncbi:MAG TPA: DNRLRE domain-containing protein [Opitutaceae bacterium]|nr:DNRLRE domain-containing protein [Opitutaceae bacterium]